MKLFDRIKRAFKRHRQTTPCPDPQQNAPCITKTIWADAPFILFATTKLAYHDICGANRDMIEDTMREKLMREIFYEMKKFIKVEINESADGLHGVARALVIDATKDKNIPKSPHVEITCAKDGGVNPDNI